MNSNRTDKNVSDNQFQQKLSGKTEMQEPRHLDTIVQGTKCTKGNSSKDWATKHASVSTIQWRMKHVN